MQELDYPFNADELFRARKTLRRKLLALDVERLKKKIAILGGSTTADIKHFIELFLLNYNIEPVFYESEYAQYWQDAMFGEELRTFEPDIVFIHTTSRNISVWPSMLHSRENIDAMLNEQFCHFANMWDRLADDIKCPVIQNNFERPAFRLLGNKDTSDFHGRTNYLSRLNQKFYEYAQSHEWFFIHDIDYLSAAYGFEEWSNPFYWHMYKYALATPAIPYFAFSFANIVKSIFGKNKKALAIDLDNTLWGGVVGDDDVRGLTIGQDSSLGQAYSEFQSYLKELKQLGVILNVLSKNEHDNAIAGLNHPDGLLKPDDFVVIKANWEPKSENLVQMAGELVLLPEAFVFLDDNPAEREIVRQSVPGVAIPDMSQVENYISAVDRAGFFEATIISTDDINRAEMYKSNVRRTQSQTAFTDYHEYLLSLGMTATIDQFDSLYRTRIAQLTNKSNQFNLTTKRYTSEEIDAVANSQDYITLYGKLTDKFGDNGVVSVIVGRIVGQDLHVDLWIMSCRVLKRQMEFAMMDELVNQCKIRGLKSIVGYYYPTAKNSMVKDFYADQDFSKESEDNRGNTVWKYGIMDDYKNKQNVIKVN